MRTIQLAGRGRSVGAVAFFTGPYKELDRAGYGIDIPNRVGFGVGNVDDAAGPDGDGLGAGKRGRFGGAVVPGETFLTGPGDVVKREAVHVDAPDGIAFAQGNI